MLLRLQHQNRQKDATSALTIFTKRALNTVFGLTSTKDDHSATISDINFYNDDQLRDAYPELFVETSVVPLAAPTDNPDFYDLNGLKVTSDNPSGLLIRSGNPISPGKKLLLPTR